MDIGKIKFLQDTDQLEEIKDGRSGAIIYKITRGNKNYFLKIFHYLLNEKSINRIKKCLEVYKKLNIKLLDLIDYGSIDNCKYYLVYNYIDGIDLKKYGDCLSHDEIKTIGFHLGKQFLKLKRYQGNEKAWFPIIDLDKISEEATTNFTTLLQKKETKDKLMQYFTMEDLVQLKKKLLEYLEITKKVKKV